MPDVETKCFGQFAEQNKGAERKERCLLSMRLFRVRASVKKFSRSEIRYWVWQFKGSFCYKIGKQVSRVVNGSVESSGGSGFKSLHNWFFCTLLNYLGYSPELNYRACQSRAIISEQVSRFLFELISSYLIVSTRLRNGL